MRQSARAVVSAAILLSSLALLSSCNSSSKSNPTGPGGGGGASLVIHIKSGSSQLGASAFTPNPASVKVGQTVQWVNDDGMGHTATATAGASFDVSVPAGSSSSGVTMPASPATISYHCAIVGHNMTGTINVTP